MKCDACGVRLKVADKFRSDDDGFTGCFPCFPISNLPADGNRFMKGPCYRQRARPAPGSAGETSDV